MNQTRSIQEQQHQQQRKISARERERISRTLRLKQGLKLAMVAKTSQSTTTNNPLRELVGDLGVALFDPLGGIQESLEHLLTVTPCSDEDDSTDQTSSDEKDEEDWWWFLENSEVPRILNESLLQQIRSKLPEALRFNKWDRCFAIERDGDSMISFLTNCAPYQFTLLVIQTTEGHILGGFATESWDAKRRQCRSYYGTGQSFLFAMNEEASLVFYHWSGDNDYCQICDPDQNRLAMGGVGEFGLVVQDNFELGQTGWCATYKNPPLVPGGRFEIAALEVYGLVPECLAVSPLSSTRSTLSGRSIFFHQE